MQENQLNAQILNQPGLCLLVEDHVNARQWMLDAIADAFIHVKVLEADSLQQAKTLLDSKPDLALLDIGLPDGSGIDLVAPLVECGCEVVMATAFTDDEHLFTALKQGATGYILKEAPKAELVEMLKGILAGQPPLSPSIARRVLQHFANDVKHIPKEPEDQNLTTRERDVLTLLAKGYTVKDVAAMLEISFYTAAGYAKTVYRKLNVSSRAEATLAAARLGYVSSD